MDTLPGRRAQEERAAQCVGADGLGDWERLSGENTGSPRAPRDLVERGKRVFRTFLWKIMNQIPFCSLFERPQLEM